MNSSRLKELSLKEFLLTRFRKSYIDTKDYYDRFIGVFIIFFIVSLAAQAYSGFSEMGFFEKHYIIYDFPYPYYISIFTVILYEILKSLVTFKAYHEYLHKNIKQINPFFIILATGLSVGSWYFSLNGIEAITKKSSPAPIDTKTTVTDSTYKANIATIDTLMARVTKRYTHKGKYYMPKKETIYHSQKQLDNDWAMMNKLETQKAEITANYNVQRTLNIQDFAKIKSDHEIELSQDIKDNKFFVIIAEISFAICSFFNYFFAAKAARDYFKPEKKSEEQNPPENDPEGQNPEAENEEINETVKTFMVDGKTYQIFENENSKNTQLHTVTKKITDTLEERKCLICKEPFIVDKSKEPIAESKKKKYCSNECADIARIKNTYEKRQKVKQEKVQQKQSGR